jgi:hypothetical protein
MLKNIYFRPSPVEQNLFAHVGQEFWKGFVNYEANIGTRPVSTSV